MFRVMCYYQHKKDRYVGVQVLRITEHSDYSVMEVMPVSFLYDQPQVIGMTELIMVYDKDHGDWTEIHPFG